MGGEWWWENESWGIKSMIKLNVTFAPDLFRVKKIKLTAPGRWLIKILGCSFQVRMLSLILSAI